MKSLIIEILAKHYIFILFPLGCAAVIAKTKINIFVSLILDISIIFEVKANKTKNFALAVIPLLSSLPYLLI